MARIKAEKRLFWQDILHRQAKSGMSVRQFCAHEQVSEPSFYAWRRKLREASRPEPTSREIGSPRTGREFISLALLEDAGAVEVIHPLGYRLRFTGDVNVAALERVLKVLDGRSTG